MKRGWLLPIVAGISLSLALTVGPAAGQEVKKKAESPEEKEILGKSISEWINILREHKEAKWRQAALLALEAGNAASRTALPAILQATDQAKESNAHVRRDAIMLLGRLGAETKGALKAIAEALQTDKSELVREAAANVMGSKFTVPAQDYVTALADALKDPHPGTRIAAATALRNMGDYAKPVLPALIEAAKKTDEQPLVRAVAIHVLSHQGKDNSQTWTLLAEFLADEKNPAAVREAAAEGLGRSKSDAAEVIGALAKTLTAKNVELRKTAATSLAKLGGHAKAAWPDIQARLAKGIEADSVIRNHLIRLAGALGKEKADVVPVLKKLALEEESTENRIAAIQELGELGPLAKGAVPELSKIATVDARSQVREAAAKAVQQINGK